MKSLRKRKAQSGESPESVCALHPQICRNCGVCAKEWKSWARQYVTLYSLYFIGKSSPMCTPLWLSSDHVLTLITRPGRVTRYFCFLLIVHIVIFDILIGHEHPEASRRIEFHPDHYI